MHSPMFSVDKRCDPWCTTYMTTTTDLHNLSGNWIVGTVDGLEVQAKVFAEGSDDYGLPQERRISKLWISLPSPTVLYDFDRGSLAKNYLTDEGLSMVVSAIVEAMA